MVAQISHWLKSLPLEVPGSSGSKSLALWVSPRFVLEARDEATCGEPPRKYIETQGFADWGCAIGPHETGGFGHLPFKDAACLWHMPSSANHFRRARWRESHL